MGVPRIEFTSWLVARQADHSVNKGLKRYSLIISISKKCDVQLLGSLVILLPTDQVIPGSIYGSAVEFSSVENFSMTSAGCFCVSLSFAHVFLFLCCLCRTHFPSTDHRPSETVQLCTYTYMYPRESSSIKGDWLVNAQLMFR